MHSSIFSIIYIYRRQVININSAVWLSIFFTLHAIIAAILAVSQFLLFVSITLTGQLVLEINMQRQSKHACIIWWEEHACMS